ncbi:hypothetical protein ACU686_25325 [Yinghuangia aomiensis]
MGPRYHDPRQDPGFDLSALQLRWYDHWLKGMDTGITGTANPLHVNELVSGRWLDTRNYPPRRDHRVAPRTSTRASPAPPVPRPTTGRFAAFDRRRPRQAPGVHHLDGVEQPAHAVVDAAVPAGLLRQPGVRQLETLAHGERPHRSSSYTDRAGDRGTTVSSQARSARRWGRVRQHRTTIKNVADRHGTCWLPTAPRCQPSQGSAWSARNPRGRPRSRSRRCAPDRRRCGGRLPPVHPGASIDPGPRFSRPPATDPGDLPDVRVARPRPRHPRGHHHRRHAPPVGHHTPRRPKLLAACYSAEVGPGHPVVGHRPAGPGHRFRHPCTSVCP